MKRDLTKAKSRKKLWDSFNWGYKSPNYLNKNHSLNCGCGMCRAKTFFNRYERKKERLNARRELKSITVNPE